MWDVKIIHLSDLLVRWPSFEPNIALKSYRDSFHNQGLSQFDYLLVCGNLTGDGSEKSFRLAEAFLAHLAREFLKDESRLRVMLIPGKLDVQVDRADGPDFSRFAEFHDRFFSDEIRTKEIKAFSPHGVMFRELKDLTLAGVCHWNVQGDETFFAIVQQFSLLASGLNLRYRDGTPTLLVSAESPLLSWEMRLRLRELNIKNILESRAKITLHCFGGSDVTCLPFEPFAHQQIGISTGPRGPGESWPLRFNAIYLGAQTQNETDQYSSGKPSLQLSVHERTDQASAWIEDRLINGELNAILERGFPAFQSAAIHHSEILAYLAKWLTQGQEGIALIKGAPGTGLQEILRYPVRRQKIGEKWATILHATWRSYSFMRREISRIKSILKDQLRSRNGRPVPVDEYEIPIVILSDEAFDKPYERKGEDRWSMIDHHLASLSSESAIFLYTIETFQYVQNNRQLWSLGSIQVGGLDAGALGNLLKEYAYQLPLDHNYDGKFVRGFSGGYAGIARALLEGARQEFVRLPGPYPISQETGRKLLIKSLLSAELQDANNRLIQSIKKYTNGEDIFLYISGLVGQRMREGGLDLASSSIALSLKGLVEWGLKRGRNDPFFKASLQSTLRDMADHELIDILPDQPNTYNLRVVTPFLMRTGLFYRIFISYPSEHSDLALQLRELLEELVTARGEAIEVMMFGPHTLNSGVLPVIIVDSLKASNNFVVIFEGQYKQAYHSGEVWEWAGIWGGRLSLGAKAFAVSIAGNGTPYPLAEVPAFDLKNHGILRIAEAIARDLIPTAGISPEEGATEM